MTPHVANIDSTVHYAITCKRDRINGPTFCNGILPEGGNRFANPGRFCAKQGYSRIHCTGRLRELLFHRAARMGGHTNPLKAQSATTTYLGRWEFKTRSTRCCHPSGLDPATASRGDYHPPRLVVWIHRRSASTRVGTLSGSELFLTL